VDTSLAETALFASLTKPQLFKFYFFLVLINNLKHLLVNTNAKLVPTDTIDSFHVNKRLLLHHYFRYLESTSTFQDSNVKTSKKSSLINRETLVKFGVDFSEFLRSGHAFAKFKTLNKPNFFNPDAEILPSSAYQNTASIDSILKSLETFLKSSAKTFEYSLSYKFLGLEVSENHELFNDYMAEFFKVLFGQFKLKRDNFKMNETIVLDVHARVVQANPALRDLFGEQQQQQLDQMCLLDEFELYAECVHKYLPKVRQYNQYLLFHYVWTMQVQYLAPFFNYLSDLYSIYN
jgi:hypothetical protein